MSTIKYDPKKDLKNWLRIKSKYPADFTLNKHYPFNKKIKLTKNNFDQILKTINKSKLINYNKQAILLTKAWYKKKNRIVKNITDYLEIPYKKINFKASLTTAYIMPYDYKDKWFMIPAHKNLAEQLKVLTHELFHLYHIKKEPQTSRKKLEQTVNIFLKK